MIYTKFLFDKSLYCLKSLVQPTRINVASCYIRCHHIQPQRNDKENQILKIQSPLRFIYDFPKYLSSSNKDKDTEKRKRPVPKLILLQNPFTWLMTKIDFQCLRSVWDPSFRESEFKFGTKQAISRVSQVISDGNYEELNGLLTKAARLSLLRELERNWSARQRSLLALQRDDIQVTSPRKVHFIRIADKKFCDVDMTFLALKWAPIQNIDTLILAEIFAKFHRDYTPATIPEWTIAYFKVTRFEALRRRSKMQ